MNTSDQDDFERFMRERGHTVIGGFRKRQIEMKKANDAFDEQYAIHKRNEVLEEVAAEFDKIGDISVLFKEAANVIRRMKNE